MSGVKDELSVDMSSLSTQFQQEVAADNVISAIEPDSPNLEETVDVPDSEFWDEVPSKSTSVAKADGKSKSEANDEEVPQSNDGIIKYKANGQEVSLNVNELLKNPESRSELAKKLALVDGARKAFSDKNQLRQKVKELEAKASEGNQFKEAWDKLESLKDNRAELYKAITGEDWDSMLEREVEKRSIYANASEDDRKIMDYEERIRKFEMAQAKEADRRKKELEQTEQRKYEADRQELNNVMQKEFFKYEFDEGSNPAVANKLRNMLWRNSLADVQDYIKQGYKFSDKMVHKAFKDNASALQAFYKTSVNKATKEAVESKKSEAGAKAAAAATKNYNNNNNEFEKLASKDPLSIFQAFRRGRK